MPRCRVCASRDLENFLDLGNQPHCNNLMSSTKTREPAPRYPLLVWYCHQCTTVQIDHTVPKETMFGEYLYVSGTTQTLTHHFSDSADRLVRKLQLTPESLIVDIGSNDGTWLNCYKKWGLHAIGVEPARNLAALANASGILTINDFFNADVATNIIRAYGYPRLVTAAGVFFHLEDLHSATRGVRLLLEGGGTFCIQAIYLREILRHTEFDNIYHEHLVYWTVRSISTLLKQFELDIYDVQLLPIHGGSLELLVGLAGAHPITPAVGQFLEEEKTAGLARIDTYHQFAERVWNIGRRLSAILQDYASSGRIVYAFGAPAKGATLLNTFGITQDLVPFAVERNPLKIGKVIPGANIPILDEDEAPAPDAYLVLPWNFLPEFLEKKRDYILGGGAFIVPVPEPIVIDRGNYHQYASP